MEMQGMNMPLQMQLKRPNKMRNVVEVAAMNATIIQGFDGTTAWMLNPMAGSDPQKLPDEAAREMKERSAIDGAMMMYINEGYENYLRRRRNGERKASPQAGRSIT